MACLRQAGPPMTDRRAEYRFSWWHEGLLMHDHDYVWSERSSH